MAELQTLQVPAVGGLDNVSPPQLLAQNPGAAVTLTNYEATPNGGYKRINGYIRYGDIPDGFGHLPLRGIGYYKGIVVVVGDTILHSYNGATWYVVNKTGMSESPIKDTETIPLAKLPRLGEESVGIQTFLEGDVEVCVITDDKSAPSVLTFDDVAMTYKYVEADTEVTGYKFVTKYQDHIVVAHAATSLGGIAMSARFKAGDFTGAGSWGAQVADEITGIKVFRDFLYIFCTHSIYRVQNLESSQATQIRPVTTKIGCVDGRSIQEIGGDILFLAADGLRYLGATERIDDVSLNLVSDPIKDIVTKISPRLGAISSVVLPRKSQYRLFFTTAEGRSMGLIGTLGTNGAFQWSTTSDMNVLGITEATGSGDDVIYHLGAPSVGAYRVYRHDVGNTFDGTPFVAQWSTPYFHAGDAAIRKALHDVQIYLEADDKAEIELTVTFDHESTYTIQPEPFYLSTVVKASRYGSMKYGEAIYGAIRYPLESIFLEGSGRWIRLTFKDNADDNSSYIIRGFDLQLNAGGRI